MTHDMHSFAASTADRGPWARRSAELLVNVAPALTAGARGFAYSVGALPVAAVEEPLASAAPTASGFLVRPDTALKAVRASLGARLLLLLIAVAVKNGEEDTACARLPISSRLCSTPR